MRTCDGKTLLALAMALLFAAALARANETDDRIEKAAKESYVYKTYLKDDHVKIVSKDGVVTLTGSVAENVNRSLAEHAVADLPGVQRVDNQLTVKEPKPFLQTDDVLGTKVKAAMLFHRSVSAHNTKVSVKDGVVTLRGMANTPAEKDLATEYAKDVEGVRDVVNEMTIREKPEPARTLAEKIDDASITAQIKATLLAHRSTSMLNTKVDTKDGIVTLTGRAGSTAEKDLVTKLVADIDGVKEVKNQMTVEAAKNS